MAENIFLGNYKIRKGTGTIDWRANRQDTLDVLEQLSINLDPDATVKDLSVAEQQLVEIAKAISMDSSLLIMDEPTAALGLTESNYLMELIRRLTAQGKAIIYISHRLDEVFEIADRVTVIKDGHCVITAPISELKMGDVVHMMIGFDIEQHYPKEIHVQETALSRGRKSIDRKWGSQCELYHQGWRGIRSGGMLGSGRTEIACAIYGVDRITAGKFDYMAKRSASNHRVMRLTPESV